MWKFLAVLGTIFLMQGCSKDLCEDDIMAYVMAQNFVKQELKSPSSAEFPYFDIKNSIGALVDSSANEKEQDKNKCHFFAAGYVDSQNSFGAMIRAKFEVYLYYDKATKKWYKKALKIN